MQKRTGSTTPRHLLFANRPDLTIFENPGRRNRRKYDDHTRCGITAGFEAMGSTVAGLRSLSSEDFTWKSQAPGQWTESAHRLKCGRPGTAVGKHVEAVERGRRPRIWMVLPHLDSYCPNAVMEAMGRQWSLLIPVMSWLKMA